MSEPTPSSSATIGNVGDGIHDSNIAGRDVHVYYQMMAAAPTAEERLAAALKLLAGLPTEAIPAAGPLAAGSRMALGLNPAFVGRETELKTLAQTLKAGQTAAVGQVATVSGLGGIGKTQLAVEFVHRYGPYFAGGVYWLNFAEGAAVASEVAACGRRECLALAGDYDSLDLPTQVALVKAAWQGPTPRLLVFDNCEEEELLAEWRPVSGGCRVVVTSRRGRWQRSLGVQAVALGVLSREESVALLRKLARGREEEQGSGGAEERGREEEERVLGEIAGELGDLPLALHLAGSYLESNQGDPRLGDPARLLTRLRERELLEHPALAGEDLSYSPTNHLLHVGRTFALSYEQLKPERARDELARLVVGRAAYFAPGTAIPRELLALTVALAEDEDEAAGQMNGALARLVGLGLVEQAEAGGALRLHRLVARFVRRELGEAAGAAQAAVEAAVLAEAWQVNQAGYPGPLLAWQGQLRFITEAALERADERAADLGNELGFHLKAIGDYAGARPYFERALAIREQALGPTHPATATSLNELARLLQAQGDYAGARPYFERALAVYEQALGPAHPATATSLNNLAGLLQDQGDYAAARPYYERALAVCEQALGPTHPYTATSLNNLAGLLQDQGDYAAARPYYERALAIREQVLGPTHPDTAASLNNLGVLLKAQGDYAAARLYYERALAIYEQALGPTHPDTATSLNNLALLLQDQGDYAAAQPYFERALAIREQALGPTHPDTATSLNNLGALLKALGDTAGARLYLERALAIYEKSLGPEHPHTATTNWWLGVLAKEAGEVETAREYYRRALAVFEKVLGPEHPDTRGVRGFLEQCH